MSNENIVTIKDLKKVFLTGNRRTHVLKGVSLEIKKGQIVTIFGPSGCGKSTLLNTIIGIERPNEGYVEFLGKRIWSLNSDERADLRKRHVGIVYQQQNWIKSLSVFENLLFSAQLLGLTREESQKRVEEVLKIVNMQDYGTSFTTELSSGEQQKIGLARALISKPEILIADEPTGNLDTDAGWEVLNILKKLTETGSTVILVTHNPEYLKLSDRIAVMRDGNIIDNVSGKDGVEKDVQKILKRNNVDSKSITKISENIGDDYPKENIFINLKTYVPLIFKFFLEASVLLLVNVISRFNNNRGVNLRNKYSKLFSNIEKKSNSKDIGSLDLIEVSFKNLFFKKFRTVITILGVGMGTGFVVLLLSLGYGLERLVVKQITEAQNLHQVDVFPKTGSQLKMNDDLVSKIKDISGVDRIFKIKSIPGRVDYSGATIDVVVYGVESEYLQNAPVKLLSGEYLLESNDKFDALINKEYLTVLGLDEKIIGQYIDIHVIQTVPEDIKENKDVVKVKIVGIVEDSAPPVIYVNMDVVNLYTEDIYSQATVVISKESSLDLVRKQIESSGLETFSVVDTISQVENVFKYVRYGLLLFGTMAFAIAFLGMVNTLMVSLLERTREVGLMKILGVKRNEIRFIFITESMFIGFLGGILGVLLGTLMGYIVSLIIYLLSLSRDLDFIMISHTPLYLVIIVIVSTTLLGFFTGLYPANRAVKTEPLDALRYE